MDNEMRRMQQEAIHRVNEMQARAKQKLNEFGNTRGEASPKPETPPAAENQQAHETQRVPANPDSGLQDLFDALMEDRERTMILVLILLLFTEQADTAVIFALLYTVL